MNPVFSSATTAIRANDASAPPTVEDKASVAALSFTLVGKVEDGGEYGGEAQTTDFTPLDTGIVEKVSGAINRGEMQLSLGVSKDDAGQAILAQAFESRLPIYVEIDMPDGVGGREVDHLKVRVTQFARRIGTANDLAKVSARLAILAVY